MLADDIRRSESGESSQGNEVMFWLREIAAQLSELNDTMNHLLREQQLGAAAGKEQGK